MTMKLVSFARFVSIISLAGLISAEIACDSSKDVKEYEFFWRGQFAGFTVNGYFVFDAKTIPASGIVREENLMKLDVSFHDPMGRLLRTYEDNHLGPVDEDGKPYLNFAFDVHAEEILQDGTWDVDDAELKYRNGFMMGEGKPSKRSDFGSQDGLAFWTRPSDDKVPHLHVDDWNNQEGIGQFEFPIGFSSHEDASFMYQTTAQRIATGKVGEAYYQEVNGTVTVNKLASDIGAFGQSVRVRPSHRHAMKCMREMMVAMETTNGDKVEASKIEDSSAAVMYGGWTFMIMAVSTIGLAMSSVFQL